MIQPAFLQAFATTPVYLAATQQTSATTACATCGGAGCDCAGAAQQVTAAQPVDELDLSEQALALSEAGEASLAQPPGDVSDTESSTPVAAEEPEVADARVADRQVHGEMPAEAEDADQPGVELTEAEQQEVDELQSRDREVRAHEQAHLAAAVPYAQGGPSYEYQEGPDGRQYAVGGEVSIDTSPIPNDPEATIDKAQQIQAAARAPASPSAQDQRVAAAAAQMEAQARAEMVQQDPAQNAAAAAYGASDEAGPMGALLDLVA